MPQFLSYDILHLATLKTSPKLPKHRLRWKPIPSHLSTIDSYIHHMIWPLYLPTNLGSYHMEYAPKFTRLSYQLIWWRRSSSCRYYANNPFWETHPFYPPTKKKTWLRDVEGMNAWGPTFFSGSEKSMVFDNWGMGLPTWPVDDLPTGDCHSFVDLYGWLCYPLLSGNV